MKRSGGIHTLLAILVLLALYASYRYSHLLFHNLVELAGVLVAFLIFTLVWNTRRVLDNRYLLFIGIASLFSGVLELAHTYAYNDIGIFPGTGVDLATQLWIAFRYLFSISFFLAPFLIDRTVNAGATFAGYLVVTFALAGAIFLGWFPACYREETGMTLFKVTSEYAVSFILLASLGLLYRKRAAFDPGVFRLLGGSILAFMVSALSYTQHVTVIASADVAGHIFELLADYLIYRAVVVTGIAQPAIVLFRNLQRSEEALQRAKDELEHRVRERTAELALSNEELQEEIAERKRVEAQLVRLAAAVEAAAEAVVITDPSTGVIQYVNPAFENITGYPKEETLGRTLHFLESGQHDEEYFRDLRETLARDGVWNGKLANRKKDGAVYFEECTVAPVRNSNGEIINYVYIKRDVTEKLRFESIAASVNAMENIGYVFSGVRHEVGNPINTVNMLLGVLREKLDSLPLENVRNYLNLITEQIARVEYHLRLLKSFNQYEVQEPENVQVPAFIEKLLPLVKEDLAKQGIGIDLAAPRDAEWVVADPRALQQVLLNIITNAADALAGRTAPAISITVGKKFGRVLIRVADNGSGMTEEQQRNLFKPFYTSKPRSTGLGLVIVRKMLAQMSGDIEIASQPDQGTTVTISLPEGRDASAHKKDAPDHRRRKSVLRHGKGLPRQ